MPKKQKPKKKVKRATAYALALVVLGALALAAPAQAGVCDTVHAVAPTDWTAKWLQGVNTSAGSIEVRGGSLNLVFGPVAHCTKADSTGKSTTLVGLDFSIGASMTGDDPANPQVSSFGANAGGGLSFGDRLVAVHLQGKADPKDASKWHGQVVTMVDGLALLDLAGRATGLSR
jgi:hypothetical protein